MTELQTGQQAAQELAATYAHFGMDWDEEEKRVSRDPVTGRIVKSPDYGSDVYNNVSFSVEKRVNKMKTAQAGKRTYDEIDFVTIVTPGDSRTVIHRPVTEFDKFRFPFEYAAFKRGEKVAVHGTPIEDWDEISDESIKDLKHHNIHTVEQIANLSDSVNGPLRGFTVLKQKAKLWLDGHKKTAATEALADRDAKIEELQKKLDSVLAMLAEQGKAKKS
jgi:hypothetical protein